MKIKKYLSHVLVMIILVGFLGSVANAQNITAPPTSITVTAPATPVDTIYVPPSTETIPEVPVPSSSTTVTSASTTFTTSTAISCTSTGLGRIICLVKQLLESILPVLLALGVVYFVWGVVQFVIADGEEAKKTGKDRIIYGLVGFAVIVGMWGLVNIIVNTFGLSSTTAPTFSAIAGNGANCKAITDPAKTFQDVLCYATTIINNSIIPLIFALATVMFVWGVVNFFMVDQEGKKRAEGKQFMIWGVIALAVMLSVWGLVGVLGSTFGVTVSALPQVCPPGDKNCSSK